MTKVRGSYFPDEYYDFSLDSDKLPLFVEMLKNRGCYIDEDGHIRSKKGGMMSKLCSNGYYLTVSSYDKKSYYFMEHRVVWVWHNGPIPKGLVINHLDYNRANNKISNLEVCTQRENTLYSKPNFKPAKGEKGRDACCSNKGAEAIKYLSQVLNWSPAEINDLMNVKVHNVRRILRGERYADVVCPESIMSIYPTIVKYTMNNSLSVDEQLKNYCLGLSGEVGEVNDIFKKIFYHGKEYNPVEVLLELGDVLYYLTAIGILLNMDMTEIMMNNNAKLLGRYKNGYSIKDSLNRVEEKINQ